MCQSVGYDKQRHVQLEIVGCDLVEDLLVDSDLRRLIFYDSNGLQLIVEDYRIASFFIESIYANNSSQPNPVSADVTKIGGNSSHVSKRVCL